MAVQGKENDLVVIKMAFGNLYLGAAWAGHP